MFEWNTQEQQEQVRQTLTEKVLTVTFTKNNGDNRRKSVLGEYYCT